MEFRDSTGQVIRTRSTPLFTTPQARKGEFNIGLSYYQEREWISSIRKYGWSITEKSLLSNAQKAKLISEAETGTSSPSAGMTSTDEAQHFNN